MDEQALLEGAAERIGRRRMAEAAVRIVNAAGRPLPGAPVHIEQTRHAFLFGCNAFPLLRRSPAYNDLYARRFTDLLNYATLGFYWGSYEPAPGETREAALREQAEWCAAHGVAVKGHPLVWHETYPAWAPTEVAETKARLRDRVTEIVSGFAGLIDRWDVVNEATVSAEEKHLGTGVGQWAKVEGALALVREALGWAHAANPAAFLLYNDFNLGAGFEQLAEQLVAAGAPVSAFGIQSHMHGGEWPLSRAWQACETYARFGRPLHFTETTVLSGKHGWMEPAPWPSTPEGEEQQAEYVAQFYTLLFSHPAVEAITWWDLMDGEGAWMGAPAGLVREDLSPKPAYERLLSLVKGEWWTKTEGVTDGEGVRRFRGFLGDYRIATSGAERKMELSRGGDNSITITLSA